MKTLLSLTLLLSCSLTLMAQERTRRPIRPTPFHVEEKTIAQIHAALRSRQVTCRGLVEAYLARINAYDQKGPSLNAMVLLNPEALQTADELDARMRSGTAMRPLECIPVVVKDNYETRGLRTTAGSQSLAKFIPTRDAFVVQKIREAGAIVLFKSNMAEFAFTPLETVSSIQPGYTFNPYSLNHTTAGSSGGTAAAVAANFGSVGLGTDTGNSIRGPPRRQLSIWQKLIAPACMSCLNITRFWQCSPVATPIGSIARAMRACPRTSSGDVGSSIQYGRNCASSFI